MAPEAYVPIGSDGAGDQKVRNLQFVVLQPDGTLAIVKQQVIAVADQNGMPVDFLDAEFKGAMLDRLDLMVELLQQLISNS